MKEKVICIGDSNTCGYDPRDFFGSIYDRPWPTILSQLTKKEIVNLGMNGECVPASDMQLAYITTMLEKYVPFKQIIVMLGTNDILNRRPSKAEVIGQSMGNLIVSLKENFPESQIILVAPPPIHLGNQIPAQEVEAVSKCYQKIAIQHQTEFRDPSNWNLEISADGIHFTEQDHEIVANMLAASFRGEIFE